LNDDHYAIEASDEDHARRLVLSGEIDMSAHEVLVAAFSKELLGTDCLIVDLSAVTFLDSTGINALISGHKEAEAAGKQFIVVPGPEQVMHTLKVTGVDTVLDLSGRGVV
jgi:stage II sporulation protein AA (anti-sigma F factor antagonist)